MVVAAHAEKVYATSGAAAAAVAVSTPVVVVVACCSPSRGARQQQDDSRKEADGHDDHLATALIVVRFHSAPASESDPIKNEMKRNFIETNDHQHALLLIVFQLLLGRAAASTAAATTFPTIHPHVIPGGIAGGVATCACRTTDQKCHEVPLLLLLLAATTDCASAAALSTCAHVPWTTSTSRPAPKSGRTSTRSSRESLERLWRAFPARKDARRGLGHPFLRGRRARASAAWAACAASLPPPRDSIGASWASRWMDGWFMDGCLRPGWGQLL